MKESILEHGVAGNIKSYPSKKDVPVVPMPRRHESVPVVMVQGDLLLLLLLLWQGWKWHTSGVKRIAMSFPMIGARRRRRR